jgi:hypothetical protein
MRIEWRFVMRNNVSHIKKALSSFFGEKIAAGYTQPQALSSRPRAGAQVSVVCLTCSRLHQGSASLQTGIAIPKVVC